MELTKIRQRAERCHFCGELTHSGIDTIMVFEVPKGHEVGTLTQKLICTDCFQKCKKEALIINCDNCEGTGEVQDCDGCEELGLAGLCLGNHENYYGEGKCPDCEGRGYILHITTEKK